jgi:hypothetical protein
VVVHREATASQGVGEVMAKGNIGNLLQHFIALKVAERLVREWKQPNKAIEYIDCFSMAPWEPIEGGQPQGFVKMVRRFPNLRDQADVVASGFCRAWEQHYAKKMIPAHPQDREYPNTAVLLRSAFPDQSWNMRLHEDDSTGGGKRDKLSAWAEGQTQGEYSVDGEWSESRLIRNCPVPNDRPAFIMLDPFQVVDDHSVSADRGGYLSASRLRFLMGQHCLNLSESIRHGNSKPIVVTLFSYSDANLNVAAGIVREQFYSDSWQVESIRTGTLQGRHGRNWHGGWLVSANINCPVLQSSAQHQWDQWCVAKEK